MTISINGVDLTSYTTKYGCVEVPRRIEGRNSGTALDGSAIVDYLATKFDLTITLKPITRSELSTIRSLATSSTVSVTYLSDFSNQSRTSNYVCTISGGNVALVNGDDTRFYPVTITLKEV